MTSIRQLHEAADEARKRHDAGHQTEVWDGWTAFYDAGKPLRTAVLRYADLLSTKNYDALISAALVAHDTDVPAMCLIVSNSGPHGEPLACGYPSGHDGPHAWASLPTFTEATDGN